jgi:hypothetical protein
LILNVLSSRVCPNPADLYPPDRADRAFEHRAPEADVLKLDRFDCIGIVSSTVKLAVLPGAMAPNLSSWRLEYAKSSTPHFCRLWPSGHPPALGLPNERRGACSAILP